MSNSFRDQLIKAGVVTQEQADKAQAEQQAEREARRARRKQDGSRQSSGKQGKGTQSRGSGAGGRRDRRGRTSDGAKGRQRSSQDDSPAAVRARAAAQALARDERAVKTLRRAAEGSDKALRDELRRFIAAYDQRGKESLDSDEPYHFAHNRKVKRIHLPAAQIEALSQGALVIVNHDGRYALLPLGPACAVASVEQRRIVAVHLNGDDSAASAEAAFAGADGSTPDGGLETRVDAAEGGSEATATDAARAPVIPAEATDAKVTAEPNSP